METTTTNNTNISPVILGNSFQIIIQSTIGKPIVLIKENLANAKRILSTGANAAFWTFIFIGACGAYLALKGLSYDDVMTLLSNIHFSSK